MTSSVAGARWDPHPLVAGLPAVPRHLDSCLKFWMWNQQDNKFEPMPANIDVSIVNDANDQPILTVPTDTNGIAHFNIPNLVPEFPDVYFVVKTSDLPANFAKQASSIPAKWSTKGWRSRDGAEAGLQKAFALSTFGTSAKPIEFEIGVRLHVTPRMVSTTTGSWISPLPGAKVEFRARKGLTLPVSVDAEVDNSGFCRLFSFDIKPGSSIELHLVAEHNSTSGQFPFLRNITVDEKVLVNNVLLQPTMPLKFKVNKESVGLIDIDSTSIGYSVSGAVDSHVVSIIWLVDERLCAAFTYLHNLTEINCLWHHIMTSNWDDYHNAIVNMRALLLGGLSLPGGLVNFPRSFERVRGDQAHEFSHQILYKLANLSLADIVGEYCFGHAKMNHRLNRMSNPVSAFLEGWAEGFGNIFGAHTIGYTKEYGKFKLDMRMAELDDDGTSFDVGVYNFVLDSSKNPFPAGALDDMPNWGESVEAMVGGALYELFRDYVMPQGGNPFPTPLVPEAPQGDISKHPHLAWLTGQTAADLAARERFRRVFVYPAQALAGPSDPSMTDFIEKMRSSAAGDWPQMLPILQKFFTAFPEVEKVAPAQISTAGGAVTLTGRHFIAGAQVYIDSDDVTSTAIVVDAKTITCTAPAGSAGTKVDAKVATAEGEDVLHGALQYV
ncbi:MAG: hypothetical protein QOD42_749 [Sphingomonadales bacterium]|jgi:hypothetical protein|nr:hypothetical protein [Sphingomonadales bacterium]